MARIRTIKPEFWVDDKIVELDVLERLLFIGLWNFVDDFGYIQFSPKRIKMMVFPADEFDVSRALARLLECSRLEEFDSDQGRILKVSNWERHQRVDHATATKFTGIHPVSSREIANPRENSRALAPEGKGREGKGRDKSILSEVAEAPIRPDVLHLIEVLEQEITANGARVPSRTKKNLDAARLLLDRDGKTVEQIEKAIRWAQADEFWRSNVLSMSKLREKYDQLQLSAKRKPPVAAKPNADAWMNR